MKVKSILFYISRYGEHQHRINFDEIVSLDEAVFKVERFLSVPLDDEYYDKIKDDLFPNSKREYFEVRGDCLGDCKFLEEIKEIEPGVVWIGCGS
jgi:hypothetical protein